MANGSIRVFEKNLDLVGEIDEYVSFMFVHNLFEAGAFNVTLKYSKDNENLKQKGDLLEKNRLILVGKDTERAGIIKERQYIQQGNQEILIVRGFELKYILKQRGTIPLSGDDTLSYASEIIETIAKDLVDKNCISNQLPFADLDFPLLENSTDQLRGGATTFSTRYKNLEGELKKLLFSSNFGWKITPNFTTKKWEFDLIVGQDKTSSVIFSDEYDNIDKQVLTDSDIGIFNYATIGGQGQGAARNIINTQYAVPDPESLYWLFVDGRDTNDNNELVQRGVAKLTIPGRQLNLDCDILRVSQFEAFVDYNLGDEVRFISTAFGVQVDRVITSITEYFQAGNNRVEVKFGDPVTSVEKFVDDKTDRAVE